MNQQIEKIIAEAGKLGGLIAETAASKAFLETRKQLDKDKQALGLVEDYQKQLQKIAELERSGKPVEPEDKHKLTDLQQEVASNETLKDWMKTQADFSELMRKVNKAIVEPFQDQPSGQGDQGSDQQQGG